jgi:hypothetical protein
MSPGQDTFFDNNVHDRVFEAASTDGTKVVFESRDQLDPSRFDCGEKTEIGIFCYQMVYEHDSATGRTSLVSRASVQPNVLFKSFFVSASPDLRTVTWLTSEAMTPGVEDHNSIDVYSGQDGATALVSAVSGSTGSISATRLPEPVEIFPGELGFPEIRQVLASGLSQVPARLFHVVSADGSEVFFQDVRQLTAAAAGPGILNVYLRRGTATTLVSSAAQRTLPPTVSPSNAFFGDATPDGRSVFFETASQLTDGDGNTSVDVYRYDVPTGEVSLVSAVGATGAAAFEGTGSYFITASADGSHVYFGSRDDLDPNSAPAGEAWKLYERVGGHTRFIALVPELADFLEGGTGHDETQGGSCAGKNTAIGPIFEGGDATINSGGCDTVATMRATADGSRLIFQSGQALTPAATGGLQCETGSGALPRGWEGTGGSPQTGGTPGRGCHIYSYDDATGTITLLSPGAATYGAFLRRAAFPHEFAGFPTAALNQPSLMSADGSRVFFYSKDALTPGAVQGLLNIYRSSDGMLTLVSPPGETSDAIYDGNSADGSQVFFHSRQSLIPGVDNHGQFAIYHVQLGDPPPAGPANPPSTPQPVASAPAQALTVNAAAVSMRDTPTIPPLMPAKPGALNRAQRLSKALKACRKHRSRSKRLACEKIAKGKYEPKAKPQKSRKATNR